MSPKLKRLIISLVVVLILFVSGIVAYSVLGKLSTTTVSDLRIIDPDTKVEVFDREVYLSAEEDNMFNISLDYGLASNIKWEVVSSDTSVAQVSSEGRIYTIKYLKAGQTTIKAYPAENSAINDSFVLTVKENYPVNFVIDDEKAEGDYEVSIFADNKDYTYSFKATALNDESIVNLDTLSVIDDYNKDIFDDIHIDAANSSLILHAKESHDSSKEIITIQCKVKDDQGTVVTKNFILKVNVNGYFISNLQFRVSTTPSFDGPVYVCGDGKLNDGETRVETGIVFIDTINLVYIKVRVVYTNGDMFDITKVAAIDATPSESIRIDQIKPSNNYFRITASTNAKLIVSYGGETFEYDKIYFLAGADKENFFDGKLYNQVRDQDDNLLYYEYKYWDLRYARTDTITQDGKIIGFINPAPSNCDIVIIDTDPVESEE